KSVVIDGTTVTITEDEDADLSDVFDYVKIEADSEDSTPTVDTSEMDDGVEYLGEAVSAAAVSKEASYSKKLCWSVDKQLAGDEGDGITIKGSVTLGYTANLKLYLALSYQYASVKLDLKLDGEVALTGTLTLVDISLGKISFVIVPGVNVELAPSLQVEVSASISFEFSITTTVGAYYDSDQSGIHSLCSSPTASYQTEFEGTLYVGLKLEGYVTVIDEHLTKIGLDGTAGVEITMKEEIQGLSSTSDSELHTCALCYAGTAYKKFTVSAKFELLNGVVDLKATLFSYTNKLFDFYYSADHDEWGFYTTCPYISYLCTITVKDYSGSPVSEATVACDALEEAAVTNESGIATFYLPNGAYLLTITGNGMTGTKSMTIAGSKKTLAVVLTADGTGDSGEDDSGGSGGDSGGSGDASGDGSDTEAEVETVASGTCGDDLAWTLDENGKLTISGTGAMKSWSSYSRVPWYSYISSITSVAIEDGVTSIGKYAFYGCTSLTSVTISDSVISIGSYVFHGCTSLTSVTIPGSVTSIGSYAFYNCTSLTSVTIPNGVSSVSSYMFYGCTELISVSIGKSVASISSYAFYNCTSLT
ncbi:MAG: leucine-rich repeat protein, partial [Clostridiales bacterium]|nr:leucine-rich repeat protein [Clostridiales bacterium]